MYVVTPKINELAEEERLQTECLDYVARQGKTPVFSDVFAIYCGLRAGELVHNFTINEYP